MSTRSILLEDDTARTRRSDSLSAHVGGDVSASNRKLVRGRVMALIALHGPLNGNELNDLYMLTAARRNWQTVHFDTPRKRAGELAAEGFLVILNADDPRGTAHKYATQEWSVTA